jgi:isopentenyl-diphosphate delta-isomerase
MRYHVSKRDHIPYGADLVALVDRHDREVGISEKMAAHEPPGKLHRAFSVFLFRSDGWLLLQRRASGKYHFAGRWSNSCCGHPRPGRDLIAEARRRTREELGLDCELAVVGSKIYRAVDDDSGCVEEEFDYVLVGLTDGTPTPAANEVCAIAYEHPTLVMQAVQQAPSCYTPWLPLTIGIATRSWHIRHPTISQAKHSRNSEDFDATIRS